MDIKKRSIAIILTLFIAASLVTACNRANDNTGSAVNTITNFRDIPGLTLDEIKNIEDLISERDGFSFGALYSTYAFLLPDGSTAGFFPLLCELLTDLFGIPFSIDFYDWDVLNENLLDLSLDFTGELTPTPERRKTYHMTEAIAELGLAAFVNSETTEIINAQSINGMTVGFWSQSITEHYIRLAYPDLDFTSAPLGSEAEVAEKLLSGEIDAFITPMVDAYVFMEYPFIMGKEVFPFVYAVASMTSANPELEPIISAVDKYLAAGAGFFAIHDLHINGRRSFSAYSLYNSLTDEEKAYIASLQNSNNKIPVVMEASLYPISFYNTEDNEYQGIAQDILTEISLLTSLEFNTLKLFDASWSEQLDILSYGDAAMIGDLWKSDELSDRFLWSDEPYMISNYAFLSSTETPYTDFLVQILRTGVVRGTVFEAVYHRFFPDGGNLIVFESNSDALNALESNDIDLLLTSDFLLLYQTNYREKSGFKINIPLDYLTGESYFGFNKEMETLRSIISKSQRYVDTDRIVLSWTGRVFDFERRISDERADDANLRSVILSGSIGVLFVLLFVLVVLFRKNKSTSEQLEEALVETNAASKAKSDFLSNMSHEIRTPLNAIVGMTTIGKKVKTTEEKNKALTSIGDASSHLLGVINDVLDMAKIEAGKLELIPVNFMFERMLQKVLSTIYFKANENEHKITINIDENIPRYIIADEQRLAQVIVNLLFNAVKFTPVGGEIHFNALLSEKTDDDFYITIEISDSGIGISKEQQEKLFDAFEQVNSGDTREYGGTGLGLAIVKRVVEMMGGEISVHSELGKGAKFSFTVNAKYGYKDDDINDGQLTFVTEGAFKDKKLLVAEDVELNVKILVALLEDTGLNIECVENGLLALEEIEANPDKYDIIFMDLQMPKMDGLEATRRIRALPGQDAHKLPIIAMTANVFKEDIDNCIAAGMNDHLSKPLDIDIVLQTLHDYLGVK